jgi:protein-S-isoprenylcysteine O-methyltransferase Ste14
MTKDETDNAGVMAPPPLIYAAGLLFGQGLDYLWPLALMPDRGRYPVAFIAITAAGALIAWVVFKFRKAGTKLDPRQPTSAIVTTGPFRLSRNPAYLALSLLYVGIAIATDGVWTLGMVVPVLVTMHVGVIFREERYLEAKFGEDYRRYKASVRRWL